METAFYLASSWRPSFTWLFHGDRLLPGQFIETVFYLASSLRLSFTWPVHSDRLLPGQFIETVSYLASSFRPFVQTVFYLCLLLNNQNKIKYKDIVNEIELLY